jgi:hypothetical protein
LPIRGLENDSEGFLKAPAPNADIMNGIRMVTDQHLGEQGNEFLEPELSNGEKFFVVRVGFNVRVDCAHDPLMFHSIAQLAQLFRSQEPMESARGIGRQAVDFDAADSAFFQLDFEPYLFLQRSKKLPYRGGLWPTGVNVPILKRIETGDKAGRQTFSSEFGDLLADLRARASTISAV